MNGKTKETTLERADFTSAAVNVCNCRKEEKNVLSFQKISAVVPEIEWEL